MAITYTTALGQFRLLISDVNETALVLTDEMAGGYLSLHGLTGDQVDADRSAVKRAAADALDAIATSEALVSKVIRSQDLATDGPKVAAALRAHANQLRAQATDEDNDTADGFLDVVEFSPYPSPRP